MKAYGGVDVYIHVFVTWALVGGEWSASRLATLLLWKESPVSIGQEAGWVSEPVLMTWRRENFLTLQELKLPTPLVVQPVASCYTESAILAPYMHSMPNQQMHYGSETWPVH
jgi:hypothetical protein